MIHSRHEVYVQGHRMVANTFNPRRPGPPLVFIHGITASLNMWSLPGTAQTPYVNDRTTWLALSLPGHYPAALPPDFDDRDLTPEMMADVTAAALRDVVGNTPVVLVGHSTGGFTALATAARWPEMVAGVVCVAGFARGRWTGLFRPMQQLARAGAPGAALFRLVMDLQPRLPGLMAYTVRQLMADPAATRRAGTLNSLVKQMRADRLRLDSRAMLAYFRHMPDIDISAWLDGVRAPTLVIAGEQDPIVPPEQAHHIADLVPDSQLVILPGVGHVPFLDDPPAYHAAVGAWLERHHQPEMQAAAD